MKKILLVIGTRPEAIKMAPVYLALRQVSDVFETKTCLTGQHQELVDDVLDFFSIQPDFRFNVMDESQGDMTMLTSLILAKVTTVLQVFQPDCVLVQGDTISAFAAGMAAFYSGIKVGHIEAGLRTFDKGNPFPEEFNRVALSRLADFHFAPTELSKQHLMREGIPEAHIMVCGNTAVDALLSGKKRLKSEPLPFDAGARKVLLTTIHRRENQGQVYEGICEALLELANHVDWLIVYPVHPNSNIYPVAHRLLDNVLNIKLLEPLPYGRFIQVMLAADLILTDSGGIQEEATVLGKKLLLVRETTERPEALEAGFVEIVGSEKEGLVRKVAACMQHLEGAEWKGDIAESPYGTGQAAKLIVQFLTEKLR